MEDIRRLHITIPYGDFGSVQMDIDSKLAYTFKLLQDCFDKEDVISDINLSRYTLIQAELMMLDDKLSDFFNKDEVETLSKIKRRINIIKVIN